MPTVKPNESRRHFMNRCIPYVIAEGKTPEQAAGQCAGMYRQARKDQLIAHGRRLARGEQHVSS